MHVQTHINFRVTDYLFENMPLNTYHHISSEKGLSSVTSLIVGTSQCVLIDPPFLIADAESVVSFVKSRTKNIVAAVFVTHHHPDHYFSANPILDAFPSARFFAASYVRAGIDREYDEKVLYWPKVFGRENVPAAPKKPEVYPYTFFLLKGDEQSPVCLLGPVQGDSVDHTIFWLPKERTIIAGDTVYARSVCLWFPFPRLRYVACVLGDLQEATLLAGFEQFPHLTPSSVSLCDCLPTTRMKIADFVQCADSRVVGRIGAWNPDF